MKRWHFFFTSIALIPILAITTLSYIPQPFEGVGQGLEDQLTLPRRFETMDELRQWLVKDETDQIPYEKGVFMCDDFAFALQMAALADGYLITIYPYIPHAHVLNVTQISRSQQYFWIEPRTDKVYYGPDKLEEVESSHTFMDFVLFADAYGSHRGDTNYDWQWDLNNDDNIDLIDFAMFADNYCGGT